jgi:hypothetical protein
MHVGLWNQKPAKGSLSYEADFIRSADPWHYSVRAKGNGTRNNITDINNTNIRNHDNVRISNKGNGRLLNPLKEQLKQYNLIENKHNQLEFKYISRKPPPIHFHV